MPVVSPTLSTARVVRWVAFPAALLVSGLVIGQSSYAAFTSTTSNPTNNWAAGTVSLSDDDSNTAMFTVSNLKPNQTGSKCIVVTSNGSLASSVKLYGTAPATTNALSSSINLTVELGTGGTFGSCTGFSPTSTIFPTGTLASFGTSATNYTTGLGTWTPTGTASETRTYRFTYLLKDDAPNTTQASTASIGFTWEAQNS